MTVVSLDFETRSRINLKKDRTGSSRYAKDDTTDVWCLAYAFGEEAPELWTPNDDQPPFRLLEHIAKGGTVHAHNAQFERDIFDHVMGPRYKWPVPSISQYRCTMVKALAMALPGALDEGTRAIGLPVEKDMDGRRLMLQMARPRKINEDGSVVWWDEPEKLERLYAYCKQDVVVERMFCQKLFQLSEYEQDMWEIDQRINSRGVHVDISAILAAQDIIDAENEALNRRIQEVTEGAVRECSKVEDIKKFIREKGVKVDSLAKDKLAGILARNDLTPSVREVVLLRQEAAKSSTAKLTTIINGVEEDSRVRNCFQYTQATTRRWGGRGAQLQNLPRPMGEFGQEGDPTKGVLAGHEIIDEAIDLWAHRDPAIVWMLYGPPKDVVSNCLRGLITASPGHTLVAADFESVEGVGLAWAAREKWKLDAFRAYFQGEGPKLYNVTAGKIFGCSPDEIGKGQKYQIGKVSELALGYAGGVGAFVSMGANYRLDASVLADAYPVVLESTPPLHVEAAEEMYAREKANTDLSREAWLACDMIKRNWRSEHPATTALWENLESAAEAAVRNPGEPFTAGPYTYRVVGSFLWCKLPSGGVLAYPFPKVQRVKTRWKNDKGRTVYKEQVTAMWMRSQPRRWGRRSLYSGLYAENTTQAICRDLLVASIKRAEAAGWPIVMHVHDELVAEVRADRLEKMGGLPAFEALVSELPSWAKGFPLAASGWTGKRYRKD